MTTQPQSPVTVMPPLPNRRNAELLLLGFAAFITTIALLIVEANQEQGLSWDLVGYVGTFIALMGVARGSYTFTRHLCWSWAIALGYVASVALHLLFALPHGSVP